MLDICRQVRENSQIHLRGFCSCECPLCNPIPSGLRRCRRPVVF
ncbi:hypothetical protein NEISICOT_01145 [Neisseria sicca ATCC 29256]|uniref:Uncharacterized protein n=1 Tax=Neisseria sicca ATCC 29256 TaxID=547045 RepID=C6M3J7_NEISI|nr:hypothetical protein NEISICOT_01145 [Neisseria sicca ATCC 29256]